MDLSNLKDEERCQAIIPAGKPIAAVKAHRCRRPAQVNSRYCYAHRFLEKDDDEEAELEDHALWIR